MALNLGPPVVQAQMVNQQGELKDTWATWMANLYEYIVSYMNSSGFVVPQLSDDQIAKIPASNETIIVQSYTSGILQTRINNVWYSFNLTAL